MDTPVVLNTTNTRIVVDSSSNVPEELLAAYRMLEVPALVNFGTESLRNKVDIDTETFYRRFLASTSVPTTSQPPPAFFSTAYRQAFEEGAEHVVVVTVTSKLSGTFASAQSAARQWGVERFTLWDSNTISMGSGWQAIAAARLLEQGVNTPTLTRHLASVRDATRGYATMETLKYVALSGRISNLQAGVGDLLQVKAILDIVDGRVTPTARLRGRRRSLREVVSRFRATMGSGPVNLAVIHSNAGDEAIQFAQDVRGEFEVKELHIVDLGPAVATLAGPGALGLIGHPIVS